MVFVIPFKIWHFGRDQTGIFCAQDCPIPRKSNEAKSVFNEFLKMFQLSNLGTEVGSTGMLPEYQIFDNV